MKKLVIVLYIFVFISNTYGATPSIWDVIKSLRSETESKDQILRSLGFDRGASGFKGMQTLQPQCNEKWNNYLITLSWESPYDGYILLADDANILERRQIGSATSICLLTDKKDCCDLIVLNAVNGSGTGVRKDNFIILKITGKRLMEIWKRVSYYRSFPLNMAPRDNYEIKGSIKFDDVDNDGIDELIYEIRKIKYGFDIKKNKLVQRSTKKTVEIYKLNDQGFKLWKRDENK